MNQEVFFYNLTLRKCCIHYIHTSIIDLKNVINIYDHLYREKCVNCILSDYNYFLAKKKCRILYIENFTNDRWPNTQSKLLIKNLLKLKFFSNNSMT